MSALVRVGLRFHEFRREDFAKYTLGIGEIIVRNAVVKDLTGISGGKF